MLRPHGHLLRTGDHLTPDEASLTTTVWMAGVFNALLTQGHVSINRLLSTTRSYLSLQRAHGQRIFVELDDGYHLLDVPSAWEVSPSACRWLYAHAGGLIEVRVTAPTNRHAIELGDRGPRRPAGALPAVATTSRSTATTAPRPCRSASRATRRGSSCGRSPTPTSAAASPTACFASIRRPAPTIEKVSRDALLFADGRSRRQPFLTVVTAPATRVGFRITGGLVAAPATAPAGADDEAAATRFWTAMTGPVALSATAASAVRGRRRGAAGHPPLVHPQRPDPLPGAARARAVLRRRLGHARRVPGPGRVAAGARPLGAAARPAAARLRQSEPRRRLAAVVHVLRARTQHPAGGLARRHRLLAGATRWRNTSWPPTTRRSSTPSCRSSTRPGPITRSAPRCGRTSSGRWRSSRRA